MKKEWECGWMSWEEIAPFREQLIEMELDLMITYHNPDWDIPRAYVEEHVDALEHYIASGNTFFWGVHDRVKLYGYMWGYTAPFIDKLRWNIRSVYFQDELRGGGFASLGVEETLKKADEMGCDQMSTHYAVFNDRMKGFLEKYDFAPTRMEMVREINNKKIAVLGANRQYMSFYKQAVALGYKIIAFGREEDDHICAQYAEKFYPISFAEKERILEICKKENVSGVTSFLIESALPYVYYISRGLGIPCNSEICESLTENKFTMRKCLEGAGIRIPKYQTLKSLADLGETQYPIIVKPSDSGGSRGVTLVETSDELEDAFKRAVKWSPSKTVLIEQYIGGREFSIESISYKGRHYVLQITDKVTSDAPYFVELEHHQPANISDVLWEEIENLTIEMLNALQVEYGASHTEVRLGNDGLPYIIEMGARMGGGSISSDLVRLSTGYDYVKGVLEVSTGCFKEPVIDRIAHSGIFFLSEETKSKVLPYIQNSKDYPEIIMTDIYADIKSIKCNSDRAGFFIYQKEQRMIINEEEK